MKTESTVEQPEKFSEVSLMQIAHHRRAKAPPNSTADMKGLLRTAIIQLGKATESGTVEDYAKLFQIITFAFVDPSLPTEAIAMVSQYYNQAWHSYNPHMAKTGYLAGIIFALGNGSMINALPQLAMMVSQNGVSRSDFELELQKLDFGEEAVNGPQEHDRSNTDEPAVD